MDIFLYVHGHHEVGRRTSPLNMHVEMLPLQAVCHLTWPHMAAEFELSCMQSFITDAKSKCIARGLWQGADSILAGAVYGRLATQLNM